MVNQVLEVLFMACLIGGLGNMCFLLLLGLHKLATFTVEQLGCWPVVYRGVRLLRETEAVFCADLSVEWQEEALVEVCKKWTKQGGANAS